MQGREFLEVARELLPGTLPRHRRVAIVNAYYALLLECREVLIRWGVAAPTRHQVHTQVRLKLSYASDTDLKDLGSRLELLGRRRNRANYDLTDWKVFDDPGEAQDSVQKAATCIARLDAIDSDPARRAAAIASLPP